MLISYNQRPTQTLYGAMSIVWSYLTHWKLCFIWRLFSGSLNQAESNTDNIEVTLCPKSTSLTYTVFIIFHVK